MTLIFFTSFSEGREKVVIYETDFDVDLETQALHRGWILPGGETEALTEEDPVREVDALVMHQPREDRQYLSIRVPVEPGQRYGMSYALRARDVTTREWPVSQTTAEDSDWRLLSPGAVFGPDAGEDAMTLKMGWNGAETRSARAVYRGDKLRQLNDGTVRALVQTYQHGAATGGFAAGLLVRQQRLEGEARDQNYYVYLSGAGELRIARDADNSWNGRGVTLAASEIPMPARNDRARPYLLEVVLEGDRIIARALQSDTYGVHSFSGLVRAEDRMATFTDVAAEVSVTDDAYGTGMVGLAGYSSGGRKSAEFLELKASAKSEQLKSILPRQRGAVVIADFLCAEEQRIEPAISGPGFFGTVDWAEQSRDFKEVTPEQAEILKVLLGIEGSGTARFDYLRVHGYLAELREFSPASEASVDRLRPLLSWEGDFGRYRVELSSDSDSSDDVHYIYTRDSEVRPNHALTPGRWYWRVRPWRPDRVGFTGDAGPRNSFTVSEDASPWPPAVWPEGHYWAAGSRRPFDVEIRSYRPDFTVEVEIEGVAAELQEVNGDVLTFVPGRDLEPGIHDLMVTVTDGDGERSKTREGFLNNTTPGNVSRINQDGFMEIDGEPFFPIGAFRDPEDPDGESEQVSVTASVEAGWNITFNYWTAHFGMRKAQNLLDASQEHDLRVMLRHNSGWGHMDDRCLDLARWVARFSSHPALVAWYLGDEPELYGYTNYCVEELEREIVKTDPNTVTTMVSHYLGSFGRRGDVFIPMSYVLGPYWHQPEDPLDARRMYDMGRHGQGIGTARERQPVPEGEIRPMWPLLQAFDPNVREIGDDVEAAIEELGPLGPSYEETRCMAFAGLSYNVQGILYWFFGKGRYHLIDDAPQAWEGIVHTSHELNSLKNYLLRLKAPADRLEVPDPLLVWTRQIDDRRVLALTNPVVEPMTATIDLSMYQVDFIRSIDYGEDERRLELENGSIELKFDSHQVKVFELNMALEQ